jgi:hypothetical protein
MSVHLRPKNDQRLVQDGHEPAYEYAIVEVAYHPSTLSGEFDREHGFGGFGWRRVWSDVTLDGVTIVYRKERTP